MSIVRAILDVYAACDADDGTALQLLKQVLKEDFFVEATMESVPALIARRKSAPERLQLPNFEIR